MLHLVGSVEPIEYDGFCRIFPIAISINSRPILFTYDLTLEFSEIMYEKLNDSVKHLINLVIDMDINLLNTISLVYVISAVLTFGVLVLGITAPYGRYARSGWGMNFNANFAWLVQELPALVIPVCFLIKTGHELPGPNMLFMGLMIVHYIHR